MSLWSDKNTAPDEACARTGNVLGLGPTRTFLISWFQIPEFHQKSFLDYIFERFRDFWDFIFWKFQNSGKFSRIQKIWIPPGTAGGADTIVNTMDPIGLKSLDLRINAFPSSL